LISNTKHNKQTRLRFILSKQYAYWAYFCHNWHQVNTRLIGNPACNRDPASIGTSDVDLQLVLETRLVVEVLRYTEWTFCLGWHRTKVGHQTIHGGMLR